MDFNIGDIVVKGPNYDHFCYLTDARDNESYTVVGTDVDKIGITGNFGSTLSNVVWFHPIHFTLAKKIRRRKYVQ